MRTTLTILLVFFGLSVKAQTYTIIHSIGKIYDTKSEKYLTKGMRIDESAKLKFESSDAKAAVLSSSRGRFVIQEQENVAGKSEIAYALSSVLSPARGRLSTRSGGINNKLDFEKRFGEGPVAILGNTYKVAVSSTAYPMSDNRFFYASYAYKGEVINKKLSNEGDSLVFEASDFYSVDDKSIDPAEVSDVKLFYFNATSEQSELITSLELVVINKDDIKYLMENIGGGTTSEKEKNVAEIIAMLYGKCSESDVRRALAKSAQ
ncbi:hypothetical protein [Reichenbachiella sp. MALMAid0571]|uniref:hypothetical protein n=1 Tax=Reichenbachiella sp. MALMAid0571 TaxID=3143939 RepID=UPI0032DE9D63